MGTTVSSGFAGLQSSGLARVGFSKYLIEKGRENDFLSGIINDQWDKDVVNCMQTVQFTIKPDVGAWRDYNSTQVMVADEVTPNFISLQICRAVYKAIQVDEIDEIRLCDRFRMFEASFVESLWVNLATKFRLYALGEMYASAEHFGKNAGLSATIDFGTVSDPVQLDSDNIHKIFTRARRVLSEKNRWSTAKDEMYAVINPEIEEAFLNSEKFQRVNETGQGGQSQLLNGNIWGYILGFKIYVSNDVPVNNGAVNILFGWKQAYIFYSNVVRSRIQPQPTSFTKEYQSLAIYDGKAIMPDALVSAWVKVI